MWFGNPLLNELRALIGAMEELKNDLIALEEGSILQNSDRLKKLVRHIRMILAHIQHYSDKELELFAQEDISRNCAALVKQIKDEFNRYNKILESLAYRNTLEERNIPKIRDIRKIVELIEKAEERGVIAKKDIKFELAQKQKAQSIAKSHLNPKERGCYHFADLSRVFHVLRKGLISISYAKREFGYDLAQGVDNMQGHDFLSVFDTYSYWILYEYFFDTGILPKIKEGEISEEMISAALRESPQLNFSKFAEENLKILRRQDLFRGNTKNLMYFEFIEQTIYHIENNILATFPTGLVSGLGDITFVIDDTAELFPIHNNAYAFEGLFKDYITPEKIIGIITIKEMYKPYLEEFVKFVGIPLYNAEGKLIWPK